jgi:hypothetical protein
VHRGRALASRSAALLSQLIDRQMTDHAEQPAPQREAGRRRALQRREPGLLLEVFRRRAIEEQAARQPADRLHVREQRLGIEWRRLWLVHGARDGSRHRR